MVGLAWGWGVCRLREAVHPPTSAPWAAKPMREGEKPETYPEWSPRMAATNLERQ